MHANAPTRNTGTNCALQVLPRKNNPGKKTAPLRRDEVVGWT